MSSTSTMTLTRWFRVASGAKYDVSIAAITDTPEREKEVTFSDSYYMDDQAIVTKVDNTDITADNYSEKLNNADATIIVSLARPPSPLPRRTSPRPRSSPTRTLPSASAPCSPIRVTP
ncbi:MAG: transporter substrate-binding domain-containing protein [Collinsella sp.]